MNFSHFASTAVILLGMTQAAFAQSPAATGTAGSTAGSSTVTPGVVATIDVTRLPIDLRRVEERLRQSRTREERDGLNLRYFIDVFAKAPTLVLLTKEDNLVYGGVPGSAPTHSDMIEMMTPREYRNHGGANILSGSKKK